jgi:hypothetical protein
MHEGSLYSRLSPCLSPLSSIKFGKQKFLFLLLADHHPHLSHLHSSLFTCGCVSEVTRRCTCPRSHLRFHNVDPAQPQQFSGRCTTGGRVPEWRLSALRDADFHPSIPFHFVTLVPPPLCISPLWSEVKVKARFWDSDVRHLKVEAALEEVSRKLSAKMDVKVMVRLSPET